MKKLLKWFTLVEILIVIVIIGILIGALVPRMQSAQWRARDVARKNDLSQLQAAIITSYSDRWRWPWDSNTVWQSVNSMEDALLGAWLNWIPKDPISTNQVYLWSTAGENNTATPTAIPAGEYWYLVADKNWVDDAWFVLMAHAEVEWGANWIYCEDNTATYSEGGENSAKTFDGWLITNGDDLKNIIICTDMHYHKWESACGVQSNYDWDKRGGECHYDDPKELRYILTY